MPPVGITVLPLNITIQVFTKALFSVIYASTVEYASNYMITNTGKVANSASTN